MTTLPLTLGAARAALEGVIADQLREAWERGLETAPHGTWGRADRGAPDAAEAIAAAVDDYAAAAIRLLQERPPAPAITAETAAALAAASPARGPTSPRPVGPDDGDIAVVHCTAAWTFAPGHRMRAARCVFCGELIGAEPATVVGAAALAGEACSCGGVVSDVFLIHAGHLPAAADALQAAISRGLHCDRPHQ